MMSILALSGCGQAARQQDLGPRPAAVQRDATITVDFPISSELQDLAHSVIERDTGLTGRHYVSLLEAGEDALLARIHLIRAARHSIDIQAFIWVDDGVGRLVFTELLRAARRGVRVRLLVDHFCKMNDPNVLARAASAHANLDVSIYNPIADRRQNTTADYIGTATTRFRLLNQRMHNKNMIVDGRIGVTGGRNIEDRYFDWDPRFNFRDRDILVVGPVVQRMQASFDGYWQHTLARPALELVDVSAAMQDDRPLDLPPRDLAEFAALSGQADERDLISGHPRLSLYPVGRVEFVGDAPDKIIHGSRSGVVTDRLGDILASAERSIIMQTPYMLMSDGAMRNLRRLRREHPGIRLVFSTNSLAATDAFYVYALSFKQRRQYVKQLGLEIHELMPVPTDIRAMVPALEALRRGSRGGQPEYETMYSGLVPIDVDGPRVCLHAKSFVVDGRASFIGSHNFDPRSNRLNTECGLLVWDQEVADMLSDQILRDAAPQNSWVLGRRPRLPVAGELSDAVAAVSRSLPLMDIWPFRYTTSYALRPGMTAVPPQDPDFLEHYEDVGQFPQVGLSRERLLTRLVAAFGGWGKSLL